MRATRLILAAPCLLALLLTAAPAAAGERAPATDRAKILEAELTRRSVDLVPYLQPDADPRLRRLAIRALGRIGDDGNAPGILRDLLATAKGGEDERLLLWAAGTARSKELVEPLLEAMGRHLEAENWDLVGQAVRSLGWSGADDEYWAHVGRLTGAIDQPDLVASAIIALGRAGYGGREVLLALAKHADDPGRGIREAADYACWLLAARHARAEDAKDEIWDGDKEIAKHFLGHLQAEDPERRMAGIRVLGSLLPSVCPEGGEFGAIYALVQDKDPRVVQDAISRIFMKRAGNHTTAALTRALGHGDPKVRQLAAEALGKHGMPKGIDALAARFEVEPDARVREVLAIELVRHGQDEYARKLLARDDRPEDPVVRQMTEAQLLLVSQRPDALDELMTWADPGASQRAGLHAATWMTVLSGFEGKEHPKLDEWLLGFLAGGYAVDKPDRHHVLAAAVSLVAANKRMALAPTLLAMLDRTNAPLPHDEITEKALHAEVRSAILDALAKLAADEDFPEDLGAKVRAKLKRHWEKDPSPWVRQAARKAAASLEMEDVPTIDEVGQPNTWRGIPQTIHDEDGEPITRWLDADDVVRIADFLEGADARVVFETNLGSFTVALDTHAAPTHCVSLVTAVGEGVYTNTRFHRVVPNFVIQGGDPRGHGAGNGGWEIPDEISPKRFLRGALGMPKSVKDDGGCQIFVMHTGYRPLDERYTCYGDVVEGMDVVDRIRVGDRILRARVVLGGEAK